MNPEDNETFPRESEDASGAGSTLPPPPPPPSGPESEGTLDAEVEIEAVAESIEVESVDDGEPESDLEIGIDEAESTGDAEVSVDEVEVEVVDDEPALPPFPVTDAAYALPAAPPTLPPMLPEGSFPPPPASGPVPPPAAGSFPPPPASGSVPPPAAGSFPPPPASGSVPPTPMPAAPGVAPAPSPAQIEFVTTLKNLWLVPADLWSGKAAAAFGRSSERPKAPGTSWMGWVIPLLINSLLVPAVVLSRVAAEYRSYNFGALSGLMPGGYWSASEGVALFFQVMLTTMALYALLAGTNTLTNLISGGPVSYVRSISSLADANTLLWLPLVVMVIVYAIFPLGFADVVVLLISAGFLLMVAITTYIGITRQGPHRRSPLVPFSWLTIAAWLLAYGILLLFSVLFFG